MITFSAIFIQSNHLFEAFICIWFVTQYFAAKEQDKRIRIQLLGTGVLYVWLSISMFWQADNFTVTVLCFLILLIYCERYLNGTFIHHCIMGLICQMLLPLINISIVFLAGAVLHISVSTFIDENSIFYLVIMVLSKGLYALSLTIILLIFRKKKLRLYGVYIIIAVTTIVGTILAEGILYYVIKLDGVLMAFMPSMTVVSIIIWGIAVVLIMGMYKVSQLSAQEEEAASLRLQNHLQEKYIDEMKWSQQQLSKIRHDYKNHVINMKKLLEKNANSELMHYFDEMDEYYLKSTAEFVSTGNIILDSVMNTKLGVCREAGIETSCILIGEFQKIETFYLGIILFNLMDNAIEASKKELHKEIIIRIQLYEQYINILIKNKIEESVLLKNQYLNTTKENSELHGIGVRQVKELMHKQDGMVEFFEEQGFFCAHVMIPHNTM